MIVYVILVLCDVYEIQLTFQMTKFKEIVMIPN